jgi:hypothetical protein
VTLSLSYAGQRPADANRKFISGQRSASASSECRRPIRRSRWCSEID